MTTNNPATAQPFNPMQTGPLKMPKPNGSVHRVSTEDDDSASQEMIEPVFANNRFGREDLLALIRNDSKPPDGIQQCPFFTDKPLTPIILSSLSETELRLQQNINSSKALSAAHRGEWQTKENNDSFSNPWTIAVARLFVHQTVDGQRQTPEPKDPPTRNEFNESFSKTPPEKDITRRAAVSPVQPVTTFQPRNPIQKPTPIQPSAPKAFEEPVKLDEWFYLDPQNVRRGPFETTQMQAWFVSGYFHADLNIMQPGDTTYTPLGDLIRINGALTPFNAKAREQKHSPPASSTTNQSAQAHSVWSQSPAKPQESPASENSELSLESLKLLAEKERLLLEEQRKLREKQESLAREEREREEKEKRMQELHLELQRQRDEMEKRAREKEHELEMKRLEILEYERLQREKLQKLEEERKLQLAQEEINRRRESEMEFARREQEYQRLLLEADMRKKEEQRRLEELQYQQKLQKEKQEQLRRKREEEEIVIRQQQQQQQAAQQAALLAAQQKAAAMNANKTAPWVSAGKANNAPDLSKIQEQERAEMLKKQQKEDEERRQQEAATALQKKLVWGGTQSPQSNGNPWNVVKPVVKETTKIEKSSDDPFTTWLTQRIRQLSANLDPEVLSTFLQSIESPNELEDYIISYLGDSKSSKEFHQEFLAKRIELRPRRQRIADKDDLSAPATATDLAGNCASASGTTNNTGAAKKNKKAKGKQVVDILGFRPTGNPDRFNAGELDLDYSTSTRGKRK
ncbi:hypothetical protein M3Y98_00547900 [Aphelenchoides besseyi]|nr:hypothetical protein M3Y98_00547900 [Aphelenchoides besseyi]